MIATTTKPSPTGLPVEPRTRAMPLPSGHRTKDRAAFDTGITEPGRRRGPVWRLSHSFQRTTHQRLMRGGRDVPAELSRPLKSSESNVGSGVSGNGSGRWREAGDQSTPALAVIWRTELRVNLNVKYEDRHEAKQLGAKWDPVCKVWYLTDPSDLVPFTRWLHLTEDQVWSVENAPREEEEARARRRYERSLYRTTGDVDGPDRPADPANKRHDSKPAVATPRTDHTLTDCGCMHVAPWDHCQHSEPALDGAELAHIRSI